MVVKLAGPTLLPRSRAAALAVGVMLLAGWIRILPLSMPGSDTATRSESMFRAADGREYVYLGGHDSYDWLRQARTYLRTGTVCDAIVRGACLDTYTLAPVGVSMGYQRSLHVLAIAYLHRLLTLFAPNCPLSFSAFLVPVLIASLGTLPAFAIGRRLGGDVAGLAAAILVAVNPLFLVRGITSDNDAWNVTLPLVMVWAALGAAIAKQVWRQAAWALAINVVAGAHKLTWDGWLLGYAVVVAGLGLYAVVVTLRSLLRTGKRTWKSTDVRLALLAPLLVCAIAAIGALAVGLRPATLSRIIRFLTASAASPTPSGLPNAFTTVGELQRQDLRQVATLMAGVPYFFVAWLGLLLLCMPRRGWRPPHFALLIGGNYLYWYLLSYPTSSRPLLLALLAVPLVAAFVVRVAGEEETEERERAAGMLVIVWFLAGLFLAFEGVRFAMLVVPPFAIAFGVALGRLYEWLFRQTDRLRGGERSAARALALIVTLAVLVAPVRQGFATARGYVPRMNDAWWDTLTRIHDETPSDTIVETWWPYGFWVKYVADRRVGADGASLYTHVPLWLARVLLASSDLESVGLLRMLACGSDTVAPVGGERSACRLLSLTGTDVITNHGTLLELARLDAAQVDQRLSEKRVAEDVRPKILEATRCDPPPTYLVLSDEMITMPGWKYLGLWGFADQDAVANEAYVDSRWFPCRSGVSPQDRVCPLNLALGKTGTVLDAFVYARDSPAAGRLRWHGARQASSALGAPAAIVIAGQEDAESVSLADPVDPAVGVLVDVINDRVLVGSPLLLRSTFTDLMFLDGRYAKHFEKFDDRTGRRGERVVTWRIKWPPPAHSPM